MDHVDRIISFGEKVSEQHLDDFLNDVQKILPLALQRKIRVVFDLSACKWFSNQELLVFTALLRYFFEAEIEFFVRFLKVGIPENVDRRLASQIVQIWEVWKIGAVIPDNIADSVVPGSKFEKYFDISYGLVQRLKIKYNIPADSLDIYDRYGVTPFVELEKIENYDDQRVSEKLARIYKLSKATTEILQRYNCTMPFDNKTLSSIVTRELYENFLDHFKQGIFNVEKNFSFFNISLIKRLSESTNKPDTIQHVLKKNFLEEQVPELASFYYDNSSKKYINRSLLQLSFVDFGEGICRSLEKQFLQARDDQKKDILFTAGSLDDNILAYAFQFDSSKDPIDKRYLERSNIPRGLFDLLTIVRRFNGLLVARSNRGKVIFNFSQGQTFSQAVSRFGDSSKNFPGTLISIYLPERDKQNSITTIPIKPIDHLDKRSFFKKKIIHVSLFDLQVEVKSMNFLKEKFYDKLFEKFVSIFDTSTGNNLFYISFKGFEIDDRVTKKLIYFLAFDYRINISNSVIILDPPPIDYLENVNKEIQFLPEISKQFHIHPTPFIYIEAATDQISIFWLGVFLHSDILKLNELLFEVSDLRSSDFANPDGVIGNVNYYDEHRNLISLVDKNNISNILKEQKDQLEYEQVEKLILDCVKSEEGFVYLCNGNYYQEKYIQLFDLLTNKNNVRLLASALANKLIEELGDLSSYYFVCNTQSSEKIVEELIALGFFDSSRYFSAKGGLSQFIGAVKKKELPKSSKFVLVCDVLSTGYMWNKLRLALLQAEIAIAKIGVIVNGIDLEFEPAIQRYDLFSKDIVALSVFPMRKRRRYQIRELLLKKALHVRRINPYTNTPITQSNIRNAYLHSSLLGNKQFIKILDESYIKVGYFKFNNLIHPYFFDMDKLLMDRSRSNLLLRELFNKIDSVLLKDLEIIFFPKKSGVGNLDLEYLKDSILNNHALTIIELQRFSTNEGWRFPHPPEFLYDIAGNKKVMILDDGSCSGESVIQMIDEVATLNVREIIVLSIIGRVNDHKKDFFSRLKLIRSEHGEVSISVFFGSHWHVPTYYIQESPVIKEKTWLDDILNHSNIPIGIREIAENVKAELELKEIEALNNKYLIKPRTEDGEFLKDLLLTKEQIGRISTYRFYKEYFEFFDKFILEIENTEFTDDRYKTIELISAVFLHEPNLYEKVKEVLPDLTERLELFIQTILFGNPTKPNKPILSKKRLYYIWSNKNLFHLFFILYQNDELFDFLTVGKFVELINRFCLGKDGDLNYLFYRLLKYLPHNSTTKYEMKYAGKARWLVNAAIENRQLNGGLVNKLKRYRSFIATLPADESDFDTAISLLNNLYSNVTDEKFHDRSITLKVDVIVSLLEVMEEEFDTFKVPQILKTWEEDISSFIESVLSFSRSYPLFFAPCDDKIYSRLEYSNESLRELHGFISDEIFSLTQRSEIGKIRNWIKRVLERFIGSNTIYYRIFINISTSDIFLEFQKFLSASRDDHPKLDLKPQRHNISQGSVAVPLYFIQEVLFKELRLNFRHAHINFPVFFTWSYSYGFLTLRIENKIDPNNRNGGSGSGISKLENLNRMPNNVVNYRKGDSVDDEATRTSKDDFVQTIIFKSI
ncbi:hypothetical protein [Chitinophaga sp. YIM B06452]|uniref:hypothetical protein n=1 Tax=Chitinophaga sp. YIM B06452 TaxID=3082158 RepID=UPI0031FF3420